MIVMKPIAIIFISIFFCHGSFGQADFSKYIATAKTSFAKPDLEDTRYNLMLALQQLDMKVGQEILKILPDKMDSLSAQKGKDNVMANTAGFIGTTIHREYGLTQKNKVDVDIVSNSPLVASLNAWLNNPMFASMGGRKSMKVDGYKGSYTYELSESTDAAGNAIKTSRSEMQIPIFSSLVTVKCDNMKEDDFIKMLNTVPVSKIAEMLK
jgi:hypothetical protein